MVSDGPYRTGVMRALGAVRKSREIVDGQGKQGAAHGASCEAGGGDALRVRGRDFGPNGSGWKPPSRRSRNALRPPLFMMSSSSARSALKEACAMADRGAFIIIPAPTPIASSP